MSDKSKLTSSPMLPATVFGNFRDEMDRLMDGFFGDNRMAAERLGLPSLSMTGVLRPAIDIAENDASIILTAELPGLVEDQIDLSIRDGVLTLKGEKKVEHDSDKDQIHIVERNFGSFQRSYPLPERVDQNAIEAKFENGVLVVTMRKKPDEASSERKIKVTKS